VNQRPYSYDRNHATRYTFVSRGKRGAIIKLVEFTPTVVKNIFNLGFGDLQPDGSIDDTANSNNDDIVKVLASVIHIIQDFTTEYIDVKIIFTGSTSRRTTLYHRILKMYYQSFIKEFVITGLINSEKGLVEVPFEPRGSVKYLAFFVKRKN
jgi:hypothetical protein